MMRISEIMRRLRARVVELDADYGDAYRQRVGDALHPAVLPGAPGMAGEVDDNQHLAFDAIFIRAEKADGARGNRREGVELRSTVDVRLHYCCRTESEREDLDLAAELMTRIGCALIEDEATLLTDAYVSDVPTVAAIVEYPGRTPYALLVSTLHILHTEAV